MRGKEMKKMDKGTNAKELRNIGISLIIHVTHEVCERKRRENGKGRGRRKKGKESNRLNLTIFLVCAFLVALSICAGVLAKQTV